MQITKSKIIKFHWWEVYPYFTFL